MYTYTHAAVHWGSIMPHALFFHWMAGLRSTSVSDYTPEDVVSYERKEN